MLRSCAGGATSSLRCLRHVSASSFPASSSSSAAGVRGMMPAATSVSVASAARRARASHQQAFLTACRFASSSSTAAAAAASSPSATSTPPRSSSSSSAPSCPLFINGKFVPSSASAFVDVLNPATQQLVTRVPLSTRAELTAAVDAAQAAFPAWRNTPVTARQRVLFNLQHLIRQHEAELVEAIVQENGKTVGDAKGDIFRGLEVVEFACGIAAHMQGETVEQLGRGVDSYSYRQPIGVCAGICPFNCQQAATDSSSSGSNILCGS